MRTLNLTVQWTAVLLLATGIAYAQVPITGGDPDTTLQNLAGAPKLVTLVFKSGAEEPNVRIIEVAPSYLKALCATGDFFPYRFEDIQEIRVQKGAVENAVFDLSGLNILSREEKNILSFALKRALDVFENKKDNQLLRMSAAVLLQFATDIPDIPEEKQQEALDYLNELAETNDLQTALEATRHLYLIGKADPDSPVIKHGLEKSGDRVYRAMAAELAGLLGVKAYEQILLEMATDRYAAISAPAIRALGRLGCQEALPLLLQTITEQNQLKGDAAVFALSRLGGSEVIREVKLRLDEAKGQERFRIIKVLYALEDPLGEELLKEEGLVYPTLELESALILAMKGDYLGKQILYQKLDSSFGESVQILVGRARMAEALVKGGDRRAVTFLQDLLRTDEPAVTGEVCRILTVLGDHSLLGIAKPVVETQNEDVALAACQAIVAMIYEDFHERFGEIRT